MSNYVVQKFLACLILGAALNLHGPKADAAILGSETPTSFSLSLNSNDFPPIDGPIIDNPGPGLGRNQRWTLFDEQYWNLTTYAQDHGPRVFTVRYLAPNLSANSYTYLLFQPYITPFDPQIDPNPAIIQASYLVHSPPPAPDNVFTTQCEKGSPDCAFFDLQHSPIQLIGGDPSIPIDPVSVEIDGDYQPPGESLGNPKSVPEPSTEIGSFAALGILAFRLFQKRLTQGKSHNT
jgi:hypothetical protein